MKPYKIAAMTLLVTFTTILSSCGKPVNTRHGDLADGSGAIVAGGSSSEGGASPGGGDLCEARLRQLRRTLRETYQYAGADDLKLPPNLGAKAYSVGMLEALQLAKLKCLSASDESYAIQFPKDSPICRLDRRDKTFFIECDFNRFPALKMIDQIIELNHQYALSKGFETQTGNRTNDYAVSSQLDQALLRSSVDKIPIAYPNFEADPADAANVLARRGRTFACQAASEADRPFFRHDEIEALGPKLFHASLDKSGKTSVYEVICENNRCFDRTNELTITFDPTKNDPFGAMTLTVVHPGQPLNLATAKCVEIKTTIELATVASEEKSELSKPLCVNRLRQIRGDIEEWLKADNFRNLKLPSGVRTDDYKQGMSAVANHVTLNCVQPGDADFPIQINGTAKICKFLDNANDPSIVCDAKKFGALSKSDQYVLLHHEFAGLAHFEKPVGDQSTYFISNQLAGYPTNGTDQLEKINWNLPTYSPLYAKIMKKAGITLSCDAGPRDKSDGDYRGSFIELVGGKTYFVRAEFPSTKLQVEELQAGYFEDPNSYFVHSMGARATIDRHHPNKLAAEVVPESHEVFRAAHCRQ